MVLLGLAAAAGWSLPGFPRTVTDAWGTTVTIPAPPQAIVSLTLPSDELLFALVDPTRLKAVDALAIDPGISNVVDQAKKVPRRITADLERVVGLRPDLVLVAEWKDRGFVDSLREAGLTVFVFRSPTTFAGLTTTIGQLADLVGEEARGRALVDQINHRLAAFDAEFPPRNPKPSVLLYSFDGSTYGRGTSFDALASRAGFVNAATQAGLAGWPHLSKEQVLALDPDLIVLPSWNYDGHNDPEAFLAAFLDDPAFLSLKAIKNHRVMVLPDRHLQATSQYMVDGVEDLARALWR